MTTNTTTAAPDRGESTGETFPVLQVLYSPSGGLTCRTPIRLRAGSFAIRRGPTIETDTSGISLPDPAVSRKHATLDVEGDGSASIRDTSTHGTFSWGRRIVSAAVQPGDILRVGNTLLIFRVEKRDEGPDVALPELLGVSPSMRDLRRAIVQIGPTPANVLIAGETGTGKEVVARALHVKSRRTGPFVAVNCAAIPAGLAESMLFGHVKGGFTGASDAQEGMFRRAESGTLVLDEIGELAPAVQAKLLRAIEERAVTPVGATRPIACSARIVAATNVDLMQAMKDQTFRVDLHTRLSDTTLALVPLRERREDIVPILAAALGDEGVLAPDLVEALFCHDWPGNVRELIKVVTDLRVRGAGQARLELSLVAARLRPRGEVVESSPPATRMTGPPTEAALRDLVREHGRNISQLARVTGRSRRQIRRDLEAVGLGADPSGEDAD
jgi:DNA-binding NtrC family response regulator